MTMQGGVVVSYSGCEMRILDACSVGGKYVYQRTTLSTDTIEIRDEDELYSKLPLGAVSLEGELARSGRIAVRTTVVGQLRLTENKPATGNDACSRATHVITGVAVGSFKLLSGGFSSAGGGVGVAVVGEAKGKTSRSEQTVREAGDPSACSEATDESAPANCRSPIQVFLSPLPSESGSAQPGTQASGAARRGNQPPPSDSLRINFAAYNAADRWRLHDGNGSPLCDLPCSEWVPKEGNYFLQLETSDGVKKVKLPKLAYSPDRQVDATIQPGRGSKAWGIILTSVGGAVTFGGLVWMLAQSIDETPNLVGPAILSLSGAAVTTGGIFLIIYSRRENWLDFQVSPEPATRPGPALFKLKLLPGSVSGTF